MKDIKSPLIIVSFSIILFTLFYLLNKIQKLKQDQVTLTENFVKLQIAEDFYHSYFDNNMQMTAIIADDIFCKVNQNNGELLSEIVRNNSILMFWFSGSTCTDCYTNLLTELHSVLSDSFCINKIRGFCSHLTEGELLKLKRVNKIKFPIYQIPSNSFEWIVGKNIGSFFFILSPNMKISHIYVPDKDFPEPNKKYLEVVKNFLDND